MAKTLVTVVVPAEEEEWINKSLRGDRKSSGRLIKSGSRGMDTQSHSPDLRDTTRQPNCNNLGSFKALQLHFNNINIIYSHANKR